MVGVRFVCPTLRGPSGPAWVTRPRCSSPPVGTGSPHWIRQSSGRQALMQMEDMAAHWGFQRTYGTIAEVGEQNKSDNCPIQMMASEI